MPIDQIMQSPLAWTIGCAAIVLVVSRFYQPVAKGDTDLARAFLNELNIHGKAAADERKRALIAEAFAKMPKPADPK